MDLLLLNLGVAAVLETLGLALTWRLIWPRWKRLGKPLFYLAVTAALTAWLGAWALLFVIGHPLLGWRMHTRFCRRHGMNPWRVDDPARYIELSKEAIQRLARDRSATDPSGPSTPP